MNMDEDGIDLFLEVYMRRVLVATDHSNDDNSLSTAFMIEILGLKIRQGLTATRRKQVPAHPPICTP